MRYFYILSAVLHSCSFTPIFPQNYSQVHLWCYCISLVFLTLINEITKCLNLCSETTCLQDEVPLDPCTFCELEKYGQFDDINKPFNY